MRTFKFYLLAAVSIQFIACSEKKTSWNIQSSSATVFSDGSCPFLTKNREGKPVISWINEKDSAHRSFYFAVSPDEGKTFQEVQEIPGSEKIHPHGENIPKVLFMPGGKIIAAWGESNPNPNNPYSGLVYYSQSYDRGQNWTKPSTISQDPASIDQRYFDLALLPNGEAGIIWLDNRKQWKTTGSALYFASTDKTSGFTNEKLIGGPACECCRTGLFIDNNHRAHVIYRAIIQDSIRDMVHIVANDSHFNFSSPQRISNDDWVINGCPHTGPAMTENKFGLHFTWFTGGKGAGVYYASKLNDPPGEFSKRDVVSGRSAKHSQILTLADNNLLIAWNESFIEGGSLRNRIGLELRDGQGKSLVKKFITPSSGDATFPVLITTGKKDVLLAYTETKGKSENIMLQTIRIWKE